MKSHIPTLLSLSLAFALAAAPVAAQDISTSHGVRALPRIGGLTTEAQFRQALASAEQILGEVLSDVDALERARASAGADTNDVAAKLRLARAEFGRAQATFDAMDKKYRDDLAAFQLRQADQEAEVQRQRAQAAVIAPLPPEQRDAAEVGRLNEWAAKIGKQHEALEAERTRLLADHDKVEAERVRLAKQRTDTEAMDTGDQSRRRAYGQLRTTIEFVEKVREQLNRVAARTEPRSVLLDTAATRLRDWEARAANATR